MAKGYRAKPASYYFKELKPGLHWELAKFPGGGGGDDNQPSDTYTIKCESVGGKPYCDCPASFRGPRGGKVECKHVGWLRRWNRINEDKLIKEGQVAYYDSSDDKFRTLEGLEF